jgi:hypothetical protein
MALEGMTPFSRRNSMSSAAFGSSGAKVISFMRPFAAATSSLAKAKSTGIT